MSKTYILGPVEKEYAGGTRIMLGLEDLPFTGSEDLTGSFFQFGDIVIGFTSSEEEDGALTIRFENSDYHVKFVIVENVVDNSMMEVHGMYTESIPAGTYTVSIYTEDSEDESPSMPERAGLPDMNVTYVYNGEHQSAIKRIATYLTGDAAEDPGYSSMEIIAKKLLARVEGGSTEAFASPMDAIAWAVENGAIDAQTEGEKDDTK